MGGGMNIYIMNANRLFGVWQDQLYIYNQLYKQIMVHYLTFKLFESLRATTHRV